MLNIIINNYINNFRSTLDNFPTETVLKLVDLFYTAYKERKFVYTMGNGGSGLVASHIIQDLVKHTIVTDKKDETIEGSRFKGFCLSECSSTLSAWANDVGYDSIYAQVLTNVVETGDIVIGISGSGNSKNIIKAIEVAKAKGAVTVGFTGGTGGKLKEICDCCFVTPSDINYIVEDVHNIVVHLVCDILRSIVQDKIKYEH